MLKLALNKKIPLAKSFSSFVKKEESSMLVSIQQKTRQIMSRLRLSRRKIIQTSIVLSSSIFFVIGTFLVYSARQTQSYILPHELINGNIKDKRLNSNIQVAGVIVPGSIKHEGEFTQFTITDFKHSVECVSRGAMAQWIQDGETAVVCGRVTDKLNRDRMALDFSIGKHSETQEDYRVNDGDLNKKLGQYFIESNPALKDQPMAI